MKTILCVEDNLTILHNNRDALENQGYRALTAETLAQARDLLARCAPDAVVLDIMLPDGLGLDLLRELRDAGSQIPVLLLTAWGRPADIAKGLRAGANDYIAKPFDYEVLLARVDTMFRSAERVPESVTKGALTLDLAAMTAFLRGEDMLLTQKEFSLLLLFIQNEGRVLRADYLYERVWKAPLGADNRTLKKHVSGLRKHLEDARSGFTIAVIRGDGYCFSES